MATVLNNSAYLENVALLISTDLLITIIDFKL